MGACDARTQGAPICRHIGATEDVAACVPSAARQHRLHSGSSSKRVLRSIAVVPLGLGVLVGATGWLYLMRPSVGLPGPAIRDALPLDELSRHASVSVLLFLAVWSVAGGLLGALARWARVERLTAGLLLALGVGGWAYAVNGLSILIVRQIPADQAFHAAAAEQSVVLPALLAGMGGALAGRQRVSARPRAPLVVSWLVAAVGVLAIVDAVFPEHRRSLVTALDPTHVHGLSKALVAPLGFALLVSARGLARRQHRAWQLALALSAALVILHVQRRFDEGVVLTGLAALALLARRTDFTLRGDPSAKPRIARHALIAALGILGYGVVTLWVNRLMADQQYTLGFALRETGRALLGLSLRQSPHLSGAVGDWFPVSVFLLGVGSAAMLVFEWLAPWRYRLRQEARERELVRTLVRAWGSDTLAPFTLRSDKSYFVSESERAFLAYRVVGGVAVVSGDPIGPPEELRPLLESFIEFAHVRAWRIAVLGVSERSLELYRSVGLRALYHGDEAVIETAGFSLDGRAIRKVRQSVHRLEKAGFRARVLQPREVGVDLRAELEQVARAWRGEAPERGFAMALDALFRVDDAVLVVGFDAAGRPHGFLHFAVCRAGSALSLSSMPRLRSTPNGFNEWLICEAIAWASEQDLARVSLNFSPFAALLAPEVKLSAGQKVQAAALRSLKGHFQLDNLLQFNRKFFPGWERRFVVYERRRDLPRVGIAALAAEAYLPFQRQAL
jgi:lysyl-tRNA synthetase class 2